MTLVGKIFTVLVFIMSISFMMLAVTVFATHRNWRDLVIEPGGLKQQIEKYDARVKALGLEIEDVRDSLSMEQAARRFALAAGQTRLADLSDDLNIKVSQFTNLQGTHDLTVQQLTKNSDLLKLVTENNERLRAEIREAKLARDGFFTQVVTLTDDVNRMEGNLLTLKEYNDGLLVQNGKMARVMRLFEITVDTDVAGIAPRLDGYVTAVSDKNLIEISIGSDDGLRAHHFMEVYRKNTYVGRVEIVMVEPDRAVAKIIPEFRRGIIKKGDRVATKLS